VRVPKVTRKEYELVQIDNGRLEVRDEEGFNYDFPIPNRFPCDKELAKRIEEAFLQEKLITVTLLSAMGTEAIREMTVN